MKNSPQREWIRMKQRSTRRNSCGCCDFAYDCCRHGQRRRTSVDGRKPLRRAVSLLSLGKSRAIEIALHDQMTRTTRDPARKAATLLPKEEADPLVQNPQEAPTVVAARVRARWECPREKGAPPCPITELFLVFTALHPRIHPADALSFTYHQRW